MQPPETEPTKLDRQAEKLSAKLAESTTRLSFLGRLGAAALAIAGGSAVAAAVKPDEADAFHFCGHLWTTGSCPSPYPPLSRIDRKGFPLHPQSGRPIDNLGRVVDSAGYAVDGSGNRLRGPDGAVPASRRRARGSARTGRPRPRASTISVSRARGSAVAAARCASSSTAAPSAAAGSTAMHRSPATAGAAAGSTASCTTTRGCRADRDRRRPRRPDGRGLRRLVALRTVDARDLHSRRVRKPQAPDRSPRPSSPWPRSRPRRPSASPSVSPAASSGPPMRSGPLPRSRSLAAAREAGLVRLPLPQARRQVPERWRFELPLPVWSTGYGAGLGAGFFTYQPVSTFWVALVGALALARPVPAALCLSLYGAGRAFMVIWPRRRADDPTAAVERLTRRRGELLRVNVVASPGLRRPPARRCARRGRGHARRRQRVRPDASEGTLAFATRDGQVVVRPFGGGPEVVFPNASQPVARRGVPRLYRLRRHPGRPLGERQRGRPDRNATSPIPRSTGRDSRSSPRRLVRRRLVVRNLVSGAHKRPTRRRGPRNDLGRPSLAPGASPGTGCRARSRASSSRHSRRFEPGGRQEQDRHADQPHARRARSPGSSPARGSAYLRARPGRHGEEAAVAREDEGPTRATGRRALAGDRAY